MASPRTTRAIIFFLTLFSAFGAVRAEADTISWGVPVAAAGSTEQVGLPIVNKDATPDGINNPTPGWIKYFVPLRVSGTYGVTDATPDWTPGCTDGVDCVGTFADSGFGNRSLNMYLMFTPVEPAPLASASLWFQFADLDLNGVNDPVGFFESVQLFSGGTAMTPLITVAPNSGSINDINWQLTSGGNNSPVNLNLSGSGLNSLLHGPAPFWARARFATAYYRPGGTNTAEYLRARLTTSSITSVPEPGSLLLLGTGLLGLVAARSRRQQA